MAGTPSTLRTAALIAGGALSVHELRFLIAPSGAAEESAGHGYLPLAGFVVAVALAVAFAQLAAVARRALYTGRHQPRGPRFAIAWSATTVSIATVFLAQEIVEAALTGRASAGLAGVLGSGGWVALPLAVAIGALVALALAGAHAVVVAAARRGERFPLARVTLEKVVFRLQPGHRPVFAPLAGRQAGRAPPPLL